MYKQSLVRTWCRMAASPLGTTTNFKGEHKMKRFIIVLMLVTLAVLPLLLLKRPKYTT